MQVEYGQENQELQDIDPVAALQASIEETNLVSKIKEEDLTELSVMCKRDLESDEESIAEWKRDLEDWMDIANQVRESKTFPWADASNIKYPLILTAAMQFNARAYPSLVPSDGKMVKGSVIGKDPDGLKNERALRVARFMSWQLMKDMPNWEEEMDHLLVILPIVGMVVKKQYKDGHTGKICSRMVLPENFIVNYWTKSLDEAERTSEIIKISDRLLKEKQRSGEYADVELGQPDTSEEAQGIWELIEQHTFYDLDNDGYAEPIVVLFERRSGSILKVTARFDSESIIAEGKKIVYIKPLVYYTKYGFIKSIDGSFYDKGFAQLLGPINEAVNTHINQLTDAGTLNNLQSGFLGKGLKIPKGGHQFTPGEWKTVTTTADDIRKQIVPLPTKDPSNVLFQLLGMLIEAGNKLASVSDIFVGKMPGQNTPATTTMATIEQGMKLFTAIYKRVYRSLEKEFKNLYRLNYLYFPKEAVSILDEPISREDFNTKDYDICPSADPTVSSQTEKLLKAQGLVEMLSVFGPSGLLDPKEVLIRLLEAQEQPNWEKLIPGMAQTGAPQPQQQPDPAMIEMQMKQEAEQSKAAVKQQEIERKSLADERSKELDMVMKAQDHAEERAHKQAMNALEIEKAEKMQNIFERKAEASLRQEKAKSNEKPSSSNGKTT